MQVIPEDDNTSSSGVDPASSTRPHFDLSRKLTVDLSSREHLRVSNQKLQQKISPEEGKKIATSAVERIYTWHKTSKSSKALFV